MTTDNRSFPILTTTVLFACSLFSLLVSEAFAQRQPETGFQFTNSYVTGSFDAVNVNNGNVIINIPIASLPKGRGTSPGAVVTLQYNSKLWASKQAVFSGNIQAGGEDLPDESQFYVYSTNTLRQSERGGWKILSGYRLKWSDRLSLENPNPCLLGDAQEKLAARWKMEMEFPDGSVRQFVPVGGSTITLDGFYNVDFNGTRYVATKYTPPAGNGLCRCFTTKPRSVPPE